MLEFFTLDHFCSQRPSTKISPVANFALWKFYFRDNPEVKLQIECVLLLQIECAFFVNFVTACDFEEVLGEQICDLC